MRFLVAALGPLEAEDAFQETFLAALRAWPRVRDDGRLDRWVLRIASRKAIDHHRRTASGAVPADPVPDRPEAPPGVGDPALWEAVSALPPKQRVAVALRSVFGWPYADVAEVLGCSTEAARASVSEGLKKLRGALS
jgi:RNA polymerase sigma factor (sigma-70 family)